MNTEYNMYIYKSVKTSIEVATRNPKILKSVPDHLKTYLAICDKICS